MKLKSGILFLLLGFSTACAQLMDWQLLPSNNFDRMEFSSSGNFYAISGYFNKVYKSTNDGITWAQIFSSYVTLTSLKVKGDTIFIGDDGGKLHVSIDAGNSFILLQTFPTAIRCIEYAKINVNTFLIAGTASNGLYFSNDFGATWIQKEFAGKTVWTLKISGYKIFAGTLSGGLYISENFGQTWTPKTISYAGESVWSFESAESDSIFYAGNNKVYKSTDWGNTWALSLNSSSYCIKYSKVEDEIYAGEYMSSDSGATWQKVFPETTEWIAIKDSTTYILNLSPSDLYREEHNPYQGKNYFPLSVGNNWQYLGYHYSYDATSGNTWYNIMAATVSYDTIINNTKYYRIDGSGFNNFFRYADNKLFRYGPSGEDLQMDFNLKWGQSFPVGNPTANITEGYQELFGYNRYFKAVGLSVGPSGREFKYYTDSIGYSYSSFWGSLPMGSGYDGRTELIQAKIKIGDSLFLFKADYIPTLNIDAALIQNDSTFTIGLIANHPYDKNGSTPQTSIFFVDSVEIEYFFSKNSDSTGIFRKLLYQQPNSNFFIDNIYFPDSFYYNGYNLNYRFHSKDKGIIPTYAVNPETGYLVFHLDPTGVKSDGIKNISFKLYQNYPNPFNPTTTIQFAVGGTQHVSLKVYDVLGNEVALLVDEEKSPGNYSVEFNAGKLSSGVYIYRLAAGSKTISNKMIVLK